MAGVRAGRAARAGGRARRAVGGAGLFDRPRAGLAEELAEFREFGTATAEGKLRVGAPGGGELDIPVFENEFWTARQRAASSLHEISYRACFKPALPRFFVERLTQEGDLVYDPFMGRGTTPLEAALLGRRAAGGDVNPLSRVLALPRFSPPTLQEVARRLAEVPGEPPGQVPEELLVFYHPATLRRLCALREWLLARAEGDPVDAWIRMVALNRLTGHSPGFFSVYTLPPNQAVSVVSQRRINARRNQTPPQRDVAGLILRKSRVLLRDVTVQARRRLAASEPLLLCGPADLTPELPEASVALVVTSPPFLDVVDYAGDNWLRCWFLGVDVSRVPVTVTGKLEAWTRSMEQVFRELFRVVRPGGHVAFEVGEVRGGLLRLEEAVAPAAMAAGFTPVLVLINRQTFTKTAHCWGVSNGRAGTNTNRVVLLRREG